MRVKFLRTINDEPRLKEKGGVAANQSDNKIALHPDSSSKQLQIMFTMIGTLEEVHNNTPKMIERGQRNRPKP